MPPRIAPTAVLPSAVSSSKARPGSPPPSNSTPRPMIVIRMRPPTSIAVKPRFSRTDSLIPMKLITPMIRSRAIAPTSTSTSMKTLR